MMDTMSTDNDDICSVESYDSTEEDVASSPSNERDEYQEVEKSTQDDTIRLQLWRVVVTIVLLSCTLAVTVTTYYVLEAENENNFEAAVSFLLATSTVCRVRNDAKQEQPWDLCC